MQVWPPVRQRQAVSQRAFRGENKLDPFAIQDEYATRSENFVSDSYPALSVRPGYSVLGTFGTKVLGIGVWQYKELHAVFNDGTWRRLNADGTWTQLASGLSTTAEWSFTNYQGNLANINLIGSNGVDSIKRYDGSAVQNLSGAPAGGNYITTYQNRLWCFVSSYNEVWASSLDKADDWGTFAGEETDSFRITIESPNGEQVNGLFAELAKLTVSFPGSIRKLMGGVPSDFNDQSVSQTIGIMNNKSGVTVDGMMFFLSPQGFYQYGGGVSPDKSFSEVVEDYVGRMNKSAASVVGSDGRCLYFSLALSGTTPDTILMYDSSNRAWHAWKDFSALHIVRMGESLYIGDASGRVLKMGGTTDGGVPITSRLVSKPFTAPSLSQQMRWLRIWVTLDLPVGSSVSLYLSKSASGDSDWVQVRAPVTGTGSIVRRPILFPSNLVGRSEQIRYKIEGSGPYTIHEVSWEPAVMPMR